MSVSRDNRKPHRGQHSWNDEVYGIIVRNRDGMLQPKYTIEAQEAFLQIIKNIGDVMYFCKGAFPDVVEDMNGFMDKGKYAKKRPLSGLELHQIVTEANLWQYR